MPGEIDGQLRSEIIECQRARSEFLRWKLVLVSGLGAAGLGLGEKVAPVPVLLALIPLVCVYVDSVCIHNDSRIMMIAEFMRDSPHASVEARAYERHCHVNRGRFYNEGLALFVSSLLLSLVVGSIGSAQLWMGVHTLDALVLTASGALGLLLASVLLVNFYLIQRGKRPLQLVQ